MPTPTPPIDPADARLEAYLDGLLDDDEVARLEAELDASSALRRALATAERVQDELRLMPQPLAPPGFAAAVLAEVERRRARAPFGRIRLALTETLRASRAAAHGLWRPVLTTAMLLLIVLSGVLFGRTASAPAPESAEVQQATDEVKWVLAYLSQVGRQAGEVVREDVLEPHVVRPVQSALGPFLDDSPSAPDPDAVP